MNLTLVAGTIGGTVGLISIFVSNSISKAKMEENAISIEEFKALDKNSYEVYYIGIEKQFKDLNVEGIKLLDFNQLSKLKKLKTIEELPFDASKELILVFATPMVVKQYEKALGKFDLKYRCLGDHKSVSNNF